MNFFQRLSSLLPFGGSREYRALLSEPVHKYEVIDNVGNSQSSFLSAALGANGKGAEPSAILGSFSAVPTLRQTAGRVAEMTAATRWTLYAAKSSARKTARQLRNMKATTADNMQERKDLLRKAVEAGDLVEIEAHPFLLILEKANDLMTGLAFRELLQQWLDLIGEAFCQIERNEKGVPVALWPIEPPRVIEVPTRDRTHYTVRTSGGEEKIDADDMLWLKKMDPANPYGRGKGIAQALADEIDADEQAAAQIVSFFANGSLPSAVINLKGAGDDVVEAATHKLRTVHGGARNSNKVHITNAESIDIAQLMASFADSDVVSLREFENRMIRQTFGVPPEAVGVVEDSNRATIWGASTIMGANVLMPRLEFQRTEYQMKLLPMYPDSDRLLLEYDDPIPPDTETQMKLIEGSPWAFNVNDVRAVGRFELFDGDKGKERWVPTSGRLVAEEDTLSEVAAPDPAAAPVVDEEAAQAEADADAAAEGEKGVGKSSPLKAVGVDAIEAAASALQVDDLTEYTTPAMRDLLNTWGQEAADTVGVSVAWNVGNPMVANFLTQHAGEHMKLINDTSRKLLADSLAVGSLAGEDMTQLRKRVGEVFDGFTKSRTRTIARTEVLRGANWARFQAFAQTGLVDRKKWLATKDGRTRDTHKHLNGKIVDLRAHFISKSGARAMHPGGFGVAKEDINCRCVIVPVVDSKATEDERIQDALTRQMDAWEEIFAAALDKGFAAQRIRVLRVFEE